MKQNLISTIIAFVFATTITWYELNKLDYWLCVFIFLAILIALFIYKKLSKPQIALLLTAFSLGLANVWLNEHFVENKDAQLNKIVSMEALVLTVPEKANYGRAKLQVESSEFGKLQVLLKPSSLSPYPGETIKLIGKLEKPKTYESFNEKLYLRSQNIHYKLNSAEIKNIETTTTFYGKYLGILAKTQSAFSIVHKIYLPISEASLMLSMLIGRNADLAIDKEVWRQGQDLGLSHIFAASALNLASIIFVLFYVLRALKVKRKYIYGIVFASITFYAMLTGWVPSIVRAWFISSAAIGGKLVKRRTKLLNLLFVSLFFALLIDPNAIGDLGLQFSYLSCLGIVLWNSKLVKKMNFIPASWAEPIATTITAQSLILPLQLHYFGNLPLLSVLANIVAVPLSSGILILGLSASLFSLFGPFGWLIASGIDLIASVFLKLFLGWMNLLAAVPGAHFTIGKIGFAWACWLTLIVLWLGFFFQNKLVKHFVLAIGFALILAGSVLSPKYLEFNAISSRWFEASLIKTASGKKLFICAQSNKQNTENKIEKILQSKGISKIDWWIGNCAKPASLQAFHTVIPPSEEIKLEIDNKTTLKINSNAALLIYQKFSALILFSPLKAGPSQEFTLNQFLFPQGKYKNVLWNELPVADFCFLPNLPKAQRQEAMTLLKKDCVEMFNHKESKALKILSDGRNFARKI